MGFPRLGIAFCLMRIIIFWGLQWGHPYFWKPPSLVGAIEALYSLIPCRPPVTKVVRFDWLSTLKARPRRHSWV